MAKFAAISLDDVPASSTYAIARDVSGVAWSKRVSPNDYSLWLVVSELADGAVLRWGTDHGDEAVCVLEGELDVDGRRCPPGGAVVVEAGVACAVSATGPTRVAHYGPTDSAPPATAAGSERATTPIRKRGGPIHRVRRVGSVCFASSIRNLPMLMCRTITRRTRSSSCSKAS